MTTALYRRYRPDTFQDVIGQDHVTVPLMAALRGDRVTHAYLFSGPRGCGKTTSARILARCLNCERFPTDTPCGECPSCRDLATGGPGSLDVVEIDAASHNGVDDARDLRERASFAPARDRYKIFILDEAHMVTPQGFNALLKLVEEPPAHVKFIFATTEPEKVIGTIRSRTHHYPFRLVPPDVLEAYLARLCDSEDVAVGPGVFPLVVRAGGGSVRDTLSVMDQLIGGAVDGEVDYARAVALLGYTDTTMLDQCVDAIAASDGTGVFRVIDRVISSGHDPRRFVEDLLQRLRDLLVIALAGAEAGPALGSMPADELERMEIQARAIGSGALSRFADMTAQALTQMVGATSPRLQLELLMARLLVPDRSGAARPSAPETRAGAAPPRQSFSQPTAPEAQAQDGDGRAMAARIARRASAGAQGAADGPGAGGRGGADAAGRGDGPRAGGADGASAGAPAADAGGRAGADAPMPAAAPVGPGVPPGPEPTPPSTAAAESRARPPASGPAADAEMIRTRWEEVLEAAKRSRRATWALVGPHAQPGGIADGVFQVIFPSPGLVGAFENGGHGPILAEAIHQALGLRLQTRGILPGGGPSGSPDGGPGAGPGGGGPGGGSDGGRGGGPASAWGDGPGDGGGFGGGPEDGRGGGRGGPAGRSDRSGPRAEAATTAASRAQPSQEPRSSELSRSQSSRPSRGVAQADPTAGRGAETPTSAQPTRAVEDERTTPTGPEGAVAVPVWDVPDAPSSAPADSVAPAELAPPGRGGPQGTAEPVGLAPPGRGGPVHASPPAAAPAVPSAPSASSETDSWGEVAVIGRSRRVGGARPVAAPPAPPRQADAAAPSTASPDPAAAPTPPAGGTRGGTAESGRAGAAVEPAREVAPPADRGARAAAPSEASPPAVPAAPSAPAAPQDDPREDEPLATVHRLRALPDSSDGASSSRPPEPGAQTFSDGVPLPEEPGDADGPGDAWGPADAARTAGPGRAGRSGGIAGGRGDRSETTGRGDGADATDRGDRAGPGNRGGVSAAMAAARAAARGEAPSSGAQAPGPASLEEDLPSEDDEDAEEAGAVGLEVVKRLLGAIVLEEVTVTQEGR